jgi:thioredoxin-like negative regulator of GroEL
MSTTPAILLNLVAPGAGLIALGRLRSGLFAALLFLCFAELAITGTLISPAGIPVVLTIAAGALAAAVWLAAQWLLRDRVRALRDPALGQELETLREQAAEAMHGGRYGEARGLLRLAFQLDPDATETLVLLGQLHTGLGQFDRARRFWHRVVRAGDTPYRREAVDALQSLPDR